MYRAMLLGLALVFVAAAFAVALERREFRMRDDFGMEPLHDCYMNYYYYIRHDPPTSGSYFWAWSGWETGDKLGVCFTVGDISTWTGLACDPTQCHVLEEFRILDFAGYGTVRPGWCCAVEFDIYCSDEYGCPIGPPLWGSPTIYTGYGWQYIDVDPDLCITGCSIDPGAPPASPRLLVTVTHTDTRMPDYPAWGFDNISSNYLTGAPMHDGSCLEALFPRPYNSYYSRMNSGFYGPDFMYCLRCGSRTRGIQHPTRRSMVM